MATKIPLRATFDNSNNPTGIAEFQTNEYVPVSHGGTGLGSYSSNQILVGTATNTLVQKTLTAGSGISIVHGGNSIELSSTAVIPKATSAIIGGITVQNSTTSGLTLGRGEVDTVVTNQNGSGYSDNDRLKINLGNKDAILQPAEMSSDLILSVNLISEGTGYPQTSSGVTTLTAASVTSADVNSTGTGYSEANNVSTTATYGTGLVINITSVNAAGQITGISVVKGGSGYYVGDVITVGGGDNNANLVVSAVYGGIGVLGQMTNQGTSYVAGTDVATTGGSGEGLTLNTTVSSGNVTGAVVSYGGYGYSLNDHVTITGGDVNAVFKITNIKGSGSGYTVDITSVKTGDLVHAKKTNTSIQVGPGSGNSNVISYLNVDKYGHIQGTIETKQLDLALDAVAMAIALGG